MSLKLFSYLLFKWFLLGSIASIIVAAASSQNKLYDYDKS